LAQLSLDPRALDFIWGNGERPIRLLISVLIILAVMSIYDVVQFGDPQRLGNYSSALATSFAVFIGVLTPHYYPVTYLALIAFIRLVAIAFFLSIIIKRFNRR